MSDRLYELMTLQDLAKMLVISTRSVMRRVRDGSLPAPIKMGRYLRWDRSVIEERIASHKHEKSSV